MKVTILVEVRPIVQACWAHLTVPSPQACAKLVVRSNDLTVTWSVGSHDVFSQTVSLPSAISIKFEPCQVSSLVQEEDHLSFRVQTSPQNLTGSFSLQFVESSGHESQSRESAPGIPCHTPCSIVCSCCGQNILSKNSVTFKRVLPLPSGSYEAGDFFCHNHGDSDIHTNPNDNDCLYSSSGFHLHPSLLIAKEGVVHCKKCLAWLGTRSTTRACLWYSTVDVQLPADCKTQVRKLNPAEEFIMIIQQAIRQCPTVACRILLEVKVESNITHFLLINVIDRQLILLTASSSLSKELELHRAIKVSFHLERHCNTMVREWSNHPLVTCIEVALPVFVQGIKLLSSTSQLIPCSHRKAHHGFLLAYLCDNFIEK